MQERVGPSSLEALDGRHRIEPVREFLERLERVVRREGVEDALGFLGIGEGVVRLAATEQLEPSTKNKWTKAARRVSAFVIEIRVFCVAGDVGLEVYTG